MLPPQLIQSQLNDCFYLFLHHHHDSLLSRSLRGITLANYFRID